MYLLYLMPRLKGVIKMEMFTLCTFSHNKKKNGSLKYLLLDYHTKHGTGDMSVNGLEGHCPHRGESAPALPHTEPSFQSICPLITSCTFKLKYKFLKGARSYSSYILELNTILNM